jgi:membrane fusion protein, multidrug efflux system
MNLDKTDAIGPGGQLSINRGSRLQPFGRHVSGWLAVACVVVVAAIIWFEHGRSAKPAAPPPQVPVSVAVAKKGDLDIYLSQIGTVTPFATVSVKSRIAGQILQLRFKEGDMVEAGQPLFVIDPSPYKAQLDQYKGQLARDVATMDNARTTLDRYDALFRDGVIAKQDRDNQQAAYEQAVGTVENDRGLIEAANVNLNYTVITSPIKGRIGLRQVDLGNYVQPADTLVVITQLQPISVIFSVPEDNISAIAKALATDRTVTVQAWNRDFSQHLADGTLLTFDNVIDQSTGTVKLRAQFVNDDYALFPDEFVNARLLIKTIVDTILVPTAAVQRTAHGAAYLYVTMKNQTVERRPVTVVATQGDTTALSAGVDPGEMVVTDGLDKLQPGSLVSARLAPASQATANAAAL